MGVDLGMGMGRWFVLGLARKTLEYYRMLGNDFSWLVFKFYLFVFSSLLFCAYGCLTYVEIWSCSVEKFVGIRIVLV